MARPLSRSRHPPYHRYKVCPWAQFGFPTAGELCTSAFPSDSCVHHCALCSQVLAGSLCRGYSDVSEEPGDNRPASTVHAFHTHLERTMKAFTR